MVPDILCVHDAPSGSRGSLRYRGAAGRPISRHTHSPSFCLCRLPSARCFPFLCMTCTAVICLCVCVCLCHDDAAHGGRNQEPHISRTQNTSKIPRYTIEPISKICRYAAPPAHFVFCWCRSLSCLCCLCTCQHTQRTQQHAFLSPSPHQRPNMKPLSHERAESIALTFTQNPAASQQASVLQRTFRARTVLNDTILLLYKENLFTFNVTTNTSILFVLYYHILNFETRRTLIGQSLLSA